MENALQGFVGLEKLQATWISGGRSESKRVRLSVGSWL